MYRGVAGERVRIRSGNRDLLLQEAPAFAGDTDRG